MKIKTRLRFPAVAFCLFVFRKIFGSLPTRQHRAGLSRKNCCKNDKPDAEDEFDERLHDAPPCMGDFIMEVGCSQGWILSGVDTVRVWQSEAAFFIFGDGGRGFCHSSILIYPTGYYIMLRYYFLMPYISNNIVYSIQSSYPTKLSASPHRGDFVRDLLTHQVNTAARPASGNPTPGNSPPPPIPTNLQPEEAPPPEISRPPEKTNRHPPRLASDERPWRSVPEESATRSPA